MCDEDLLVLCSEIKEEECIENKPFEMNELGDKVSPKEGIDA